MRLFVLVLRAFAIGFLHGFVRGYIRQVSREPTDLALQRGNMPLNTTMVRPQE